MGKNGKTDRYEKIKNRDIMQYRRLTKELYTFVEYYNKNIRGKEFSFIYNGGSIVLNINKKSFYHFLGVEYLQGENAFFSDIKNGKFSLDKTKVLKTGETILKWEVFIYLPELFNMNTKIGKGQKGLYLYYDYILKTKNESCALGLLNIGGKKVVANSFLNTRVGNKKQSNKFYGIHAILVRDIGVKGSERLLIKKDEVLLSEDLKEYY